MRVYEGMFLLDAGKSNDWNGATAQVHGILTRYGATILESRKWDERRLAYEIGPHKRGAYMLTYFEAPPDAVATMRRDLELSDLVVRYLLIARERYTAGEGERGPAAPSEEEMARSREYGDGPPRRRRPPRDDAGGDESRDR